MEPVWKVSSFPYPTIWTGWKEKWNSIKKTGADGKSTAYPAWAISGLKPGIFDSRIRKVTMERFDQCYQAGIRLGAKRSYIIQG